MEEKNIENQPEIQEVPVETPVENPKVEEVKPVMEEVVTPTTPTSEVIKYGGFWRRVLAFLIDCVIIGIVSAPFNRGGYSSGDDANPVSSILSLVYFVTMDVVYGATLGKMALGLKVVKEGTDRKLTVGEAIMRELVGKIVSCLTLGIGYLWVAWDSKKQAVHDKIAKTLVVMK